MMYKFIYCFFICSICNDANCQTAKQTFIIAQITNSYQKKVRLKNKSLFMLSAGLKVIEIDSCNADLKNTIEFTFLLSEPTILSLEIDGSKGWLSFVVSPGDTINIDGFVDSLYRSQIAGSFQDSLLKTFSAQIIKPIMKNIIGNSIPADTLKFYMNKVYLTQIDFVERHSSDFAALLICSDLSVTQNLDSVINEKARHAFLSLSPQLRAMKIAKDISYIFFDFPNKFAVCKKMDSFKIEDVDKGVFDLSYTLQNSKLVLIDFWATWCAPCIAQFPVLQTIYSKHKKRGFEIVSISADVNMEAYRNFLKKNLITWVSVTDGSGNNSPVIKQLNISMFPSNFLIDSAGIIKGVNLSIPEIEAYLNHEPF